MHVIADVTTMEKRTTCDMHLVVLQCLCWWTSHNEMGLSRTGIISNLGNLLRDFIHFNMNQKVGL